MKKLLILMVAIMLPSMANAVSMDEELSNMIKFQHAYNASSRYINTVSEMIEHLINTLGV